MMGKCVWCGRDLKDGEEITGVAGAQFCKDEADCILYRYQAILKKRLKDSTDKTDEIDSLNCDCIEECELLKTAMKETRDAIDEAQKLRERFEGAMLEVGRLRAELRNGPGCPQEPRKAPSTAPDTSCPVCGALKPNADAWRGVP